MKKLNKVCSYITKYNRYKRYNNWTCHVLTQLEKDFIRKGICDEIVCSTSISRNDVNPYRIYINTKKYQDILTHIERVNSLKSKFYDTSIIDKFVTKYNFRDQFELGYNFSTTGRIEKCKFYLCQDETFEITNLTNSELGCVNDDIWSNIIKLYENITNKYNAMLCLELQPDGDVFYKFYPHFVEEDINTLLSSNMLSNHLVEIITTAKELNANSVTLSKITGTIRADISFNKYSELIRFTELLNTQVYMIISKLYENISTGIAENCFKRIVSIWDEKDHERFTVYI